MSQFFEIHAVTPQARLVRRAVDILREGGVIVYPTDSCYALGCALGNKSCMERIARIRQTGKDHNFTLVCRDLSEIATYARIDNQAYRLIRELTPGPFTFILRATSEVPKRLQNPKRRSIGIRIPDNAIALAIVEELGQPLMSSTLLLPGDELPMTDARDIRERLEHEVDLVIDGGNCGLEPSTVLELSEGEFELIRQGKGQAPSLS